MSIKSYSTMSIFHNQLASIMEALTTAAVAEICELVDGGFTDLQLEMSQWMEENETLKRKLQTTELRFSHPSLETTNCRPFEGRVRNEPRATASEGCSQAVGMGVTGDRCRRRVAAAGEEQHDASTRQLFQCANVEEGRTESLLIKEERLEEDSDPHGEMNSREERAVGSRAAGGERPPVQETQNKPENHTEELTVTHRTRHGVWEVSGPESVLKAEAESESVNTPQHRGTERGAGGLNGLDSEFAMFERPAGRPGTYCPQGGANAEAVDPCCSYSTGTDSEIPCFRPELQFPPLKDAARTRLSDVRLETVTTDPVPVKLEAAWDEAAHAEHGRYRGDGERETARGIAATAPTSSPENANGAPPREKRHREARARERRFTCKQCGKEFPRAKELEIHQRVHTGERPYGCAQCGKRFTQACNLKTHLSVHTGDKPFICAQCGKRFTQACNLKTHLKVHSRERPFGCAECGKRFTRSCHLKRHRTVHVSPRSDEASL